MNIFIVIQEYENGGSLVLGAEMDESTALKMREEHRQITDHSVRIAEVELTLKGLQAPRC